MQEAVGSGGCGTPLCPAGHLPHKEGDWLGACSQPSIGRCMFRGGSLEARIATLVISPPVGEMPGRAEGGLLRQISRLRNKITKIGPLSSPPTKLMPTIYPSRFGYTGPHNRRDGTGALVVCRHAGGLPGAAQKMVLLSPSGGACVCRTQPGMAPQGGPCRRRGTGVARKNTPNGARRVSLLNFNSRHTTCPGRSSGRTRRRK